MVEFRDGNPDPIQIQPYSFQALSAALASNLQFVNLSSLSPHEKEASNYGG